ncbi:MAG TPA: SEC-C metal-binding domain-containing protein [Longimicrobiales bacterium]|jgi:hypothetical protein
MKATDLLEAAVDDLVECWPYMPVRSMEMLLGLGDGAYEAVADRFLRETEDPEGNPIWLGILLGVFGRAEATPLLVRAMEVAGLDDIVLPMVASEALARIGPAAVPALCSFVNAAEGDEKIMAYGALGWIDDDEAHACLLDALRSDPERAEVVAAALADQGRPGAVPALYDALCRADPWQREEMEEALVGLLHGEAGLSPLGRDWRLRYRRDPRLSLLFPNWPLIAVFARQSEERRRVTPSGPTPSLDELRARSPVGASKEPERCADCGEQIEEGMGVAVCPCTAGPVALAQMRLIEEILSDEVDDLFDVLDLVDEELEELLEKPEPRRRKARNKREDALARTQLILGACRWLIERGVEDAWEGVDVLADEVARLGEAPGEEWFVEPPEDDWFGHPEPGASKPGVPAAALAGPRAGRNDPCPCGSGRKFKKCCGKADGSKALGPVEWGRRPELVTMDGQPLCLTRSHYAVSDEAALVAVLAGCPELDEGEDDRSFTWGVDLDQDEKRILGHVRLEDGGLVLECLSEERMRAGRALLERVAGRWLTHRADTLRDPWQAAAEEAARGPSRRPPGSDLPPEDEAAIMQQVLDRHYRNWPDDPLPALRGRTARECVRTAAGREEVAELLASMEALEARKPPVQRYDFGWMWKELGIGELR